jgi:hypothetical protein
MKVSAYLGLAIPQLRQVCDSFDSAAKAVWTVAHEPGQVLRDWATIYGHQWGECW